MKIDELILLFLFFATLFAAIISQTFDFTAPVLALGLVFIGIVLGEHLTALREELASLRKQLEAVEIRAATDRHRGAEESGAGESGSATPE